MGQCVITGYNNILYNSALNNYQKNGEGYILIEDSLFYDADQGICPGEGNVFANSRFIVLEGFRLSANSSASSYL